MTTTAQQPHQTASRGLAWLCAGLWLLAAQMTWAQTCEVAPVAVPAGFPDQPINIFIPRSTASGSLPLSAEMAGAIGRVTGPDGAPLGIETNLLFRYGGSLEVALESFTELPANGYNVLQLNDTYASLLARSDVAEPPLVPLNIAQITFSQIYVHGGEGTSEDKLARFVARAGQAEAEPLKIAVFGGQGIGAGLEDFLLDTFERTQVAQAAQLPADGAPALPAFEPARFENGSERYFSLFSGAGSAGRRSDALIEQPGDVAGLIEKGLLTPIFTLLPEEDQTPELKARLGDTPSFPALRGEGCDVYYRFRGFFVPRDMPEDRRRFLEWVFVQAFNSDSFQAFNRTHFMDVLYSDPEIIDSYCSTTRADAFFLKAIDNFKACYADSPDLTR